jgi:hypothetical protein
MGPAGEIGIQVRRDRKALRITGHDRKALSGWHGL